MKNIYKMILVIAIAMMGSNSLNAAAEGPGHGRGNNYGDPIYSKAPKARHHHNEYRPAARPAVHHAPAPAPRPVVHHRPAPRPRPVVVYRNNGRRIRRAVATIAAIEATRAIVGSLVYNLPPYCREVLIDGAVFYVADNILYRPMVVNGAPCFEVVNHEFYY